MSGRKFPLFTRLPQFHEVTSDLILDRFLDFLSEKKLDLYPAQEEAILALIDGQNVILNTPTGSGKSLVATALHFQSLALGKRSFYTCPIKALVNEKFLNLCSEFGPDQVGMITGDGSVNRDAPIICCTAEILANIALRDGEDAAVDDVIMDEFHYYSDRERGVAWQIPLLVLKRARFLLMSATLGDVSFFEKQLAELTGRATTLVASGERPVPLKFEYRETPLHETIRELLGKNLAPVYLVNFTQREAAEEAQNLMSIDFITKDQKKAIAEEISQTRFSSPYGKEIQKFLKHGVGIHHAGLLPKYRLLVERLAQKGMLKVICGTDTLGVGVNVPIRSVLFTKLCKYNGEKTTLLSVRDFQQISGRAGRRGFDTEGFVVAQAPAHVIENLKMDRKAALDPKKAKKMVKLKPPEKGYVHWDEVLFQKLVTGRPEALVSRFAVSHGMLLSVLSRKNEDGCQALRSLIRVSHESEALKKKQRTLAFTLFRSLLDRKLIEFINGQLRVQVDLQDDFSLNHSLSLWLLDTIQLLDPTSETYALDVLTLVEAILESPDLILRKQLDRVKTEKLYELKAQGMEYEERMEELEKLEYPKPMREFIYDKFNEFSSLHPWVGGENIRPKSIAREMFETYQSFSEYIRDYELQRAEGLLLRYLTDAYRTLTQTVPEAAKNEELELITEYFGLIIRKIDSSLLDEWEKMRNAEGLPMLAPVEEEEQSPTPRQAVFQGKSAQRQILAEVYRFITLLSQRRFADADDFLLSWRADAETVELKADGKSNSMNAHEQDELTPHAWTAEKIENELGSFLTTHPAGLIGDARSRKLNLATFVDDPSQTFRAWRLEHTLLDKDEGLDFQGDFVIDLDASQKLMRPVITFEGIKQR